MLERLERAAVLELEQPNLRFLDGLPGVAFAMTSLFGSRLPVRLESFCRQVDSLALSATAPGRKPLPLELGGGLAGLARYASARWPRPAARRTLEQISALVDATLDSCSHTRGVPVDPAAGHYPILRRAFPAGALDCGVAHGALGVVGLLTVLERRGVPSTRRARHVSQLVGALLALRGPSGALPVVVSPRKRWLMNSAAWCNGTAGAAAVLTGAAQAFSRPGWRAIARQLTRALARQALSANGLGLCHGLAGVTLIIEHLARTEPRLVAAAEPWREALVDAVARAEVARLPLGLFEGLSGLGLALLPAPRRLQARWLVELLGLPVAPR